MEEKDSKDVVDAAKITGAVPEGGNASHLSEDNSTKIPKLMSLAANRMDMHHTKGTEKSASGLVLPNVPTTLTYDHNAFLCSLFTKIDIDKERNMFGMFHPGSNCSDKSIIADAVAQYRPVGSENLPDYKHTISSMVINSHKKVFKSDSGSASEYLPLNIQESNIYKQNFDCMRREVCRNVPPKMSMHSVRNNSSPYIIGRVYRQHLLDTEKRLSAEPGSTSSNENKSSSSICATSDCTVASSSQPVYNNVSEEGVAAEADVYSYQISPRDKRRQKEYERSQLGPLRIRRTRRSYEEDDFLNKNEQRLFAAVQSNDFATAHLLLKCGTNATCIDSRSRTPLHIASAAGYSKIVRVLLEFKADIGRLDSIGNKPMDLALISRQATTVSEFIIAVTKISEETEEGAASLKKVAQLLMDGQTLFKSDGSTSKQASATAATRSAGSSAELSRAEVTEVSQLLEECNIAEASSGGGNKPTVAELTKSLYFTR